MKTQDKQLLAILQGFSSEVVLKTIEDYKKGLDNSFLNIEGDLKKLGWVVVDNKPTDKEFYFINDKYWVQLEGYRLRDIEKAKLRKNTLNSRTTKTDIDLKYIDSLKCAECGGGLYKQKICPRCKEGKQGYSIRLICEENINHEFLI